MRKIYIDFDGVLVDTPKYINEAIQISGNNEKTFKNLNWELILKQCSSIHNNIDYLKKIYKSVDIIILTHIYSSKEEKHKIKYIKENIGDICVLTVPYNVKKCDYVDATNNLLIDDYYYNIMCWNKNGGIGLLVDKNKRLDTILAPYFEGGFI